MPGRSETFTIDRSHPGERLDKFLTTRYPAVSRGTLQRLIEEGHIRVNGRAVKPTHPPRVGEVISVHWPEARPAEAQAEDIALDVLFEDKDLLVLNKAPGIVVHPASGNEEHTLVNALLHHCKGQLSGIGGVERPGIVHRLDKPTSGVLLVAKTDEAHRGLAIQFERREVEKRYLALVHGRLPRAHDVIRLPVARDLTRRTRMTTRRREGRQAVTEYRVLETARGFTLLEASLHTGRTHQVRVHFSSLGHPLVGDTLYGAPRLLRWNDHSAPTLDRIFLHAQRLRFHHPRTSRLVEVTAPVPAELSELLHRLGFAYNA